MKVVIAPDSFKGSLTAKEAAIAIDKGVNHAFSNIKTILFPVADGGEGTVDTLVAATKGHKVAVNVTGPIGAEVEAYYGVLGDRKTCVIEVASASGIQLLQPQELNAGKTTTFGIGELIKRALDDGYRTFILALGGSATNDGGAGMLQALGMKLLDEDRREIGYGGGELGRIHHICKDEFDLRIIDSTFVIASDVKNPFVGETGASYVFGPQKGADDKMVQKLDLNLLQFANCIEQVTGMRIHDLEGAGAAGGIGGACLAFFSAKMRRGIDVVLEYAELEKHLLGADLVITGEGKVDSQTIYGKTPMGIAQLAQKHHVPTMILAGAVGEGFESLYQYGVISVHSIMNGPMTMEEAMEKASILLEITAEQVCRTYFYHHPHRKEDKL